MPFHTMHSYNIESLAKNGGQKYKQPHKGARHLWRMDLLVATDHEINPGSGTS